MHIHGITPDKTAQAPTFQELLPTLREKTGTLPLLCFGRFDVSVLEALAEHYNINYRPDLTVYDVCEFARSCIPGLPHYRLTTLSDFLHLPPFNHHDAESDAIQCALVYLSLIETTSSLSTNDSYNLASAEAIEEPWEAKFLRIAGEILADGKVTLEEAYELQNFLSTISDKSRLMQSLSGFVHIVLEDGRVTKAESKVLCALLEYVAESVALPDVTISEHKTTEVFSPSFGYKDTYRLVPDGLQIPQNYKPVLKSAVPEKYKERWPYVKDHPFATLASSQIAITGTGTQIDRLTAEEMVVALGATLKNSIPTRTTDFCVVLGSDPEYTDTGKCCRARELISQGSPIRILGEDDFIDLLKASIAENASCIQR